jgi:hypothetical protein
MSIALPSDSEDDIPKPMGSPECFDSPNKGMVNKDDKIDQDAVKLTLFQCEEEDNLMNIGGKR